MMECAGVLWLLGRSCTPVTSVSRFRPAVRLRFCVGRRNVVSGLLSGAICATWPHQTYDEESNTNSAKNGPLHSDRHGLFLSNTMPRITSPRPYPIPCQNVPTGTGAFDSAVSNGMNTSTKRPISLSTSPSILPTGSLSAGNLPLPSLECNFSASCCTSKPPHCKELRELVLLSEQTRVQMVAWFGPYSEWKRGGFASYVGTCWVPAVQLLRWSGS
jgi:hypothetical protein